MAFAEHGGGGSPTNNSYRPSGRSRRAAEDAYVYDPVTKTWVPPSSSNSTSADDTPTSTENVPYQSGDTTQVDSKGKAEKEYIEVEFNTLTGDLSLVSTEKTIRIKVNDTIKIEGIGKYLSGLYFVTAIKRTLSKDGGYSHSLTLLKNGFGNSLKQAVKEETRQEEVPKTTPELNLGDKVKIVGDDAVYSNAHDGVKVPEWVKKKELTVDGFSDDKTRVRLMPIWSWTYVKFVQKI